MYGLSNDHVEFLKNCITEVFGEKTDLKVYLFGSRAKGKERKFSDVDLAFKSKDSKLDQKISIITHKLEDSNLPYKFDLVNWKNIFKEYLPQIQKEKKIFWTKDHIVKRSPWRICPIGSHWVKEHVKRGNTDSTDSHCRKNPSGKDILKADEISLIAKLPVFNSVKLKAAPDNLGFKNGNEFDHLINGWCAYWNEILQPDELLHPNIVKALIATESGFMINPPRSSKHTAIGLLQLMPKTIGLLSLRSKELKNHYVEISKDEAFDPNVNICAAIRWLFRKRELVRRKRINTDWLDTLEEYKGITKQTSKKPAEIKSNIRELYEKLSKN